MSCVVSIDLPYRPPYDWMAMLAYFTARAIPGVERVEDGTYSRVVAEGGSIGTVHVAHAPDRQCLVAAIDLSASAAHPGIVERLRRVFDLDADVAAIGAHLSRDPVLATLVARRPGLRAPGGWDGFELAIRAVLGQQVTLAAARHLAHKLVLACAASVGTGAALTHAFPDPAAVAANDLLTLGMPGARRATLLAIARASLADAALFAPTSTLDAAIFRLRAIPGVGEWTAQYIALRALRHPDAFPATDIGLLRAAADASGVRPTPAALLARAENWRPWRAYAAQHLWAADVATLATARSASDGR